MIEKLVRIVSKGGYVGGDTTRVFNHDGTEIQNVARIEIEPLKLGAFVVARIEVLVELDIEAPADVTVTDPAA